MSKPFDKDLYETNNPAIRDWINHLKASGWKAIPNPDKYGVDVLAQNPKGEPMCFEVEVKHNWVGNEFQFQTIHIPARKMKFADDRTTFIIFNHDRNKAIAVKGQTVAESPIVKKKTIYTNQEEFIEIKKENCGIVKTILGIN